MQRVLIVAEQDVARAGLQSVLATAPRGATGIESVRALCEARLDSLAPFDVIVLACDAADATSQALLRQALRQAPTTPVVVYAEATSQDFIRTAMQAGAAGFIPASTPAGLICAALQLVMSGGRYLPEELLADPAEAATAFERQSLAAAPTEATLTPSQQRVLNLVLQGRSNKEIASTLGLTLGTVKNYVSLLLKVLHARTRAHVLATARPVLNAPHEPSADDSLIN